MTPTPQPSHADALPTLAQALAEIDVLRDRLERLEHDVALMRGDRPGPVGRRPAAAPEADSGTAGGDAASTPLAAVLAGDEVTASQHLAHLRSAISRLRDERAHATAEFRSLTQVARPEPPGADLGLERAEIAAAADTELVMVDSTTLEVVTSANEGPDEPWGFPATVKPVPAPAQADTAELAPETAQPAPAAPVVAAWQDPGRDTVAELRERLRQKEESAPVAASDVAVADPAPAPGRRRWPWLAAAVLLLAGAAALWFVTTRRATIGAGAGPTDAASVAAATPTPIPSNAPSGTPPAPPSETPAQGVTRPADGGPGDATTPAPSAPPAPLVVALTTSREVWLRVLVDGVRSLERTVAGGESLRFEAQGVVQLVAGDAGAVRLEVNGAAQGSLGPDGQVARRRVDAPAPGSASGLPQ